MKRIFSQEYIRHMGVDINKDQPFVIRVDPQKKSKPKAMQSMDSEVPESAYDYDPDQDPWAEYRN